MRSQQIKPGECDHLQALPYQAALKIGAAVLYTGLNLQDFTRLQQEDTSLTIAGIPKPEWFNFVAPAGWDN